MNDEPKPNTDSQTRPDTTPGPVNLYVLAAGLLLGVLLGPAVLGRVSPTGYAALFGGAALHAQLAEHEQGTAAMIAALRDTGVTPAAVDEQLDVRAGRADTIRQTQHAVMDRRAMHYATAVAFALVVLMLVEAGVRTGHATVALRYAVAGLLGAVWIARPSLFLFFL